MFVIVNKATRGVLGTQQLHPGDTINVELFDVFRVPPNISETDFHDEEGPVILTQVQYDKLADYSLRLDSDANDLSEYLLGHPQLLTLLKADRATIVTAISGMDITQLKTLLVVLTIAVRKLIRDDIDEG